jgi:predicted nucleic acid-binding protein
VKRPSVRAVLDTNVLVSALLFAGSRLSWLRPCWQSGQLVPVLAEPTARELLRVLAYPKFRLTSQDRERLLEDLLPWSESWRGPVPASCHSVRDPHDQVFLRADSKYQHVLGAGWRIAIASSAVMSCITACIPPRID